MESAVGLWPKFLHFFKIPRVQKAIGTFGLVLVFMPFMSKREEWYPFSHFPMYSHLGEIWTLELTDENMVPVSIQKEFQPGPNSIRKLATTRLRDLQKERSIASTKQLVLDDWAEAGRRTLQFLFENHKVRKNTRLAAAKTLKLFRVEYTLQNGKGIYNHVPILEFPNPQHDATAVPPPPPAAPKLDFPDPEN
jgi:hypothetical protein